MAQSSVTIWGVLDTALTNASGSIAKKTSMNTSSSSSSQLGFRGVEDLGGGMSALFWLEAGVAMIPVLVHLPTPTIKQAVTTQLQLAHKD
jgi:predicted porin